MKRSLSLLACAAPRAAVAFLDQRSASGLRGVLGVVRNATRATIAGLIVPMAAFCAATAGSSTATASESAQCESAATAIYADAIGDAGDAPDLATVAITPCGEALRFDIKLAQATELGRYGWILLGIDTDRNRMTGGAFGDEYVVVASGYGAVIGRWSHRHFDFGFAHSDLNATLTPTDLTFTLDSSDFHQRTFDFAVASLRQDADLAPDAGVFRYPPRNKAPSPQLPRVAHPSGSTHWGEQYSGGVQLSPGGNASLGDQAGTLRLRRHNGLITAYFLHNQKWIVVATG